MPVRAPARFEEHVVDGNGWPVLQYGVPGARRQSARRVASSLQAGLRDERARQWWLGDWALSSVGRGERSTIETRVAAGADINARWAGAHTEAPLHGPASSGDVEALDALLGAGADIEVPGAVIAGGTPLGDAVAFGPLACLPSCARSPPDEEHACIHPEEGRHLVGSHLPFELRRALLA